MESAYFTRLEKLVFKKFIFGWMYFFTKGFLWIGFVIILKL